MSVTLNEAALERLLESPDGPVGRKVAQIAAAIETEAQNNVKAYFEREVQPHVPHAWIDHERTKVGYEIAFNRYFYKYIPPRPLEEIDRDLKALSGETEPPRLFRRAPGLCQTAIGN